MGFITSLAAGLGFLLSAETLIIVGNGMGLGGVWFAVFILAGAGAHLPGAFTLFANPAGPWIETDLPQRTLGRTAAVVFPLSSRLAVAVVASTGLLATAGFVFNEVFVYWFPNFLFAFLLLGLVLAVNLAGRRVWRGFQVIAVIMTLAGLAVLVIAGLMSSPATTAVQPQATGAGLWTRMALSAVLLPVGYDLALFAYSPSSGQRLKSPAAAVLLGSLVFVLWGLVSMRWVDQASLAETTIPYTLAARAILGQEGRLIIGLVILCGVAGAVNTLFGGVSRMTAGMSAAGLLPAFLGEKRLNGRIPVLLLGGGTSAMLLLGMAGSPHLDAYLRGGLILWLIHYAVLHLAAFLGERRDTSRTMGRRVHIAGGLIMALVALGLLVSDEEREVIALFMIVVICSALILWLLWSGLACNRDQGQ